MCLFFYDVGVVVIAQLLFRPLLCTIRRRTLFLARLYLPYKLQRLFFSTGRVSRIQTRVPRRSRAPYTSRFCINVFVFDRCGIIIYAKSWMNIRTLYMKIYIIYDAITHHTINNKLLRDGARLKIRVLCIFRLCCYANANTLSAYSCSIHHVPNKASFCVPLNKT